MDGGVGGGGVQVQPISLSFRESWDIYTYIFPPGIIPHPQAIKIRNQIWKNCIKKQERNILGGGTEREWEMKIKKKEQITNTRIFRNENWRQAN